jgi:hypothetical protein
MATNSKFNRVINAHFKELNISFVNYTDNFYELRNSVARVNVFYEDLSYVQIDDNAAMTIVSLLGTLGGNLGLFLGNSFLLVLKPILG